MNIIIEDRNIFEEMLKNDEIKTAWSLLELYGIDDVINDAFEEYLKEDEIILVANIYNNGVLEANLYDGLIYKGIHVDRAYIHQNNDIILMSDYSTRILIIQNEDLKISDFYEYYHTLETVSE
ncbi:hypothetical protein [Garciella nitratireducens]|jgi:hypothetical protein|uniref:hypothetical protein n=1 Tax=Garciella nitratireducens TaxID=218205 RepID=UPI001BD3EDA3|nr:hypothetical protein [Garciella nitratireducens]